MNQNIDTIDTLVLDWLIRSGYQSTFTKLPASGCSQAQTQAQSLQFRAQIGALIKKGAILEAISAIESAQVPNNREVIILNTKIESLKNIPAGPLPLPQLIYILKLQHFLELLRLRQTPSALAWIQTHLITSAPEGFESVLQETLGVLGYAEPESSPVAWMFEQPRRYLALAALTNSSLYHAYGSAANNPTSGSPMETLLKHVKAIDSLVHELKGFGNDLDDRKWASLQNLMTNQDSKKYIKTIKND